MKKAFAAAALAATLLPPLAFADGAHGKKEQGGQGASAPADAMAEGEVRRVDKDAKKITIKHGPLANLDMPAMTMVFQVEDAAMLDAVRTGDKVKFRAEKVGGAFKLVKIERAQ